LVAGAEDVPVRILVKKSLEECLCKWNQLWSFVTVQAGVFACRKA
jgi:hypothetical protein